MNWEQSRKFLDAKKLGRGHNVPKPPSSHKRAGPRSDKGRGKGSPGKGKSRVIGALKKETVPRKTFLKGAGKGTRKPKKISKRGLLRRTKCAKCGKVGHWAAQCTNPPDAYALARMKGGKSKGNQGGPKGGQGFNGWVDPYECAPCMQVDWHPQAEPQWTWQEQSEYVPPYAPQLPMQQPPQSYAAWQPAPEQMSVPPSASVNELVQALDRTKKKAMMEIDQLEKELKHKEEQAKFQSKNSKGAAAHSIC